MVTGVCCKDYLRRTLISVPHIVFLSFRMFRVFPFQKRPLFPRCPDPLLCYCDKEARDRVRECFIKPGMRAAARS